MDAEFSERYDDIHDALFIYLKVTSSEIVTEIEKSKVILLRGWESARAASLQVEKIIERRDKGANHAICTDFQKLERKWLAKHKA